MMWLQICIAILCLLLLRKVVQYLLCPLRKIPGPTSLPIIGNLLDFYRNPDTHTLLLLWAKKYGPVFKYNMPLLGNIVYVADPRFAKQILVTNGIRYARAEGLKIILPGLGSGLSTSNGRVHALQRKHLNPEFSLASIKKYVPLFNSKARELIKFWQHSITLNKEKPIETEVFHKLSHLTLDVICLCSFGYSFDCTEGGHHEESLAADKILSASFNLFQRSIEHIFPFLRIFYSKDREELKKAEALFYGLIHKVIKTRRDEFIGHVRNDMPRNDLLQTLLGMYKNDAEEIAAKHIFHQVLTFMVAGHDTTSTAMTWTLYLLAKHPKIQERVRKEILKVTDGSSSVCWEDLEHLTTLENCIKESMRLYPVAIYVTRKSIKEDQIGQYKIPPGTNVYVGIASLHQSSEFWKDPQIFDPDRFKSIASTQQAKDSSLPYWYLPFSRGPRMCIGYRFAQAELKVVLALLLSAFSFTLCKDQPDKIEGRDFLTLKPFPLPVFEISPVKNPCTFPSL